jgi:protein TonB
MGEKGEIQRDKRRARFQRGDSILWLEFDGEIGKRSARLLVIRTHTPTRRDDSTVLGSLREQLGEPTTGRASLDSGLRAGPAVWSVAECGVVIEATREEPDWWDPSKGGIVVEARALPTVAGSAEVIDDGPAEPPPAAADGSIAPVAPPPPAKNLRGDEPAAASVGAGSDPATRSNAEPQGTGSETTPVASGESPPRPIAVAGAGGVTFPERIPRYYRKPVYPPAARRAKIAGTVYLDVIVQRDGTVGEITVVDSTRTGSGFEDAAMTAVKDWRYRPALRDGQPVDASILVRIDFQ